MIFLNIIFLTTDLMQIADRMLAQLM